jgi:hypothetical protein
MRRTAYRQPPLAFFLALSAAFAVAGCDNSCFAFTWNSVGSTGTVKVSNPPPTCSLTTANGAARLEIGAASEAGPPGTKPPHISHLFITLAGIDVHASALADDGSDGWQPLAELEEHPLQVDLLADLKASGPPAPFPDAVLPAGLYGQVRLRLATPLSAELARERDHCGAGLLHCAVMSDGRVQPLVFPRANSSFRIPSANLDAGRWLYIPPGGSVTLKIELDPERSFLLPLADRFTLAPAFHLRFEPPARIPED